MNLHTAFSTWMNLLSLLKVPWKKVTALYLDLQVCVFTAKTVPFLYAVCSNVYYTVKIPAILRNMRPSK